MADKQVYVKLFTTSNEVTDLLQTFVNRGHDLNDYFLNITMSSSGNGYKTFAVFYDKRFEDDKVNIV
jgi:hypothetical protein